MFDVPLQRFRTRSTFRDHHKTIDTVCTFVLEVYEVGGDLGDDVVDVLLGDALVAEPNSVDYVEVERGD